MDEDILRCQVRTLVTGEYASCGAEAKHFAIIVGGGALPEGKYAILMCDGHASGSESAQPIGLKANHELREHVRFFGAEPAF